MVGRGGSNSLATTHGGTAYLHYLPYRCRCRAQAGGILEDRPVVPVIRYLTYKYLHSLRCTVHYAAVSGVVNLVGS